MNSKTITTLSLLAVLLVSLIFVGCGAEIDSKNLEQLYSENGIPVKTKIVEAELFTKNLEYNAVMSGVKESSAFTSLSDAVESINYKVGDYVEKDAVVLTFPTDNPTAQYYQAKLSYENAAATFKRMERFFETGGISRQSFEDAETAFKVAQADWNAIKQSVKVKAPISGTITRINVRETENVNKDDELFTVAQMDKLKTRLWVADTDIAHIQVGQKAVADWNGNFIEGRVVQVDQAMNQMKKAFAVEVEFDNTNNLVKAGVTADVALETYRKDNTIFVERKNVIKENTDRYVFLNQNGAAKKQPVTIGLTEGISVEITSGLQAGDELVVEGQMLLKENTKLNLVTE